MLGALVSMLKRRLHYALANLKGKRMDFFLHVLRISEHDIILDIGSADGTFWTTFWPVSWRPKVIGLDLYIPFHRDGFSYFVVADALHLPFKGRTVSAVFSNSVIEHVGDFAAQREMVTEIQRVSSSYFVQVPAKSFPLEPHFLLPFVQYLPVAARVRLTKALLGREDAVYLPEKSDLARVFGSCHIHHERFFGATKSFYCWDSLPFDDQGVNDAPSCAIPEVW